MTLRELLGIEHSVIQAPMAGSQGSTLAIAVCNAGGLGSLPCATLTLDAMRNELAAITAATTRPYNVNFFCHQEPVFDQKRDEAWRTALAPYFAELGIDPEHLPAGPARVAFNAATADLLEEFRPPVVSFHFGLPSADLVVRVKGWGAKVLSSATTVDEARFLESRGVDAVIAQGSEAGGHRGMFLATDLDGQTGTLALVQQIVAAVQVPVIAAGGIANGQGVAAVGTLGAAGAQVGTAYLFCPEASTSPIHRAALSSQAARTTAITNLLTGRPARGIVNRLMREIGPMNDLAPSFPLAAAAIAPLRAAAEARGKNDFTSLWAGQNAAACREMPAAQLTQMLAAG